MIGKLIQKLNDKSATIGVIGLGYVGLPLLSLFYQKGFKVVGVDTDKTKIDKLNINENYLPHVKLPNFDKRATFTNKFVELTWCDAIIICVPTPLGKHKDPDLSYIKSAIKGLLPLYLSQGTVVSLESTTYPGTTREIIKEIIEKESPYLHVGENCFLVYSPEREDPGNKKFNTKNIPKIVSGYSDDCVRAGKALYEQVCDEVYVAPSLEVGETAKLFENIYRGVNIALVNELKIICDGLGIDVWDVLDAAETKPFGFTRFNPGPGVGGHCIGPDPAYLAWKAKEVGVPAKFIELAGEMIVEMPKYVVRKTIEALNNQAKCVYMSNILILGVAYKPDIDDVRESPAISVIQQLEDLGAYIAYFDSNVPKLKIKDIMYTSIYTLENIHTYDCVVIITNHSDVNYVVVQKTANLIIDTRNVVKGDWDNVIKA